MFYIEFGDLIGKLLKGKALTQASALKRVRRLDQSEILASLFASAILGAIVVFTGQWKEFVFWLAVPLLVGLAYLVSLIPDCLRWWRLPLLLLGYFSPGIFKSLFGTSDYLWSVAIVSSWPSTGCRSFVCAASHSASTFSSRGIPRLSPHYSS
ncbi:hypothetical protein [Dehalogenimonas alkenigignens]|uniref:hypothetical protein n=1 Tax=Dehalogenimonas alkenigignens TaxID=1217799 RepID=UPI00105826CD|nr:hypothetical protein [Dehalogenimonas alkenigignens]